jgi:Uma2 family endonuclease
VPSFSIPVSAATLDGFCAWARSDRRPPRDKSKLCFADGQIYIETADWFVSMPATALTLDGFCAWAWSDEFPQRGRVSFLDTEVFFDMSPEELQTHNAVKTIVVSGISNLNEELDLGQVYSDGALVRNRAAGLSTEPDGMFVTWEGLESGRVRLVPRHERQGQFTELDGSPDWVLEIISLTTVQKDTRRLRQQYHRAGVAEYWLIDARGADIDFKMFVRRPRGYIAVRPRGGWLHSPVFGRGFRLERWHGRMGLWRYRLHVQPA